jgi:hypothetical protein
MCPVEQQLPSLFLPIGEFDLTFQSVSLEDYIEHLQDTERLRSRWLKLRFLQDSENRESSSSTITFALERKFRGVGVWAIGSIYTDQSGKFRVVGKIGLDYWFLAFIVFDIVLAVIFSLRSEQPATIFAFFSVVLLIANLIWFLGLVSLKEKLIAHLMETLRGGH